MKFICKKYSINIVHKNRIILYFSDYMRSWLLDSVLNIHKIIGAASYAVWRKEYHSLLGKVYTLNEKEEELEKRLK